MKINTCTLQTLAAVNRFLPETHGDHRALETIDDLIVPLVMHGVNHELIAFLHMSQVIRICPMAARQSFSWLRIMVPGVGLYMLLCEDFFVSYSRPEHH